MASPTLHPSLLVHLPLLHLLLPVHFLLHLPQCFSFFWVLTHVLPHCFRLPRHLQRPSLSLDPPWQVAPLQ
ncbi:MAG: hypothetical protein M3509_02855, partial [Chloroflexota bacterium]|nr:hypothetical protein [Chloroflexota bacterium]